MRMPPSSLSAFSWLGKGMSLDAFVPDLELTALANMDLEDGSALVQATADDDLSRNWTIGGLASFTFGMRRSDCGSLPRAGSILLRLIRYL